MGSRSRPGALLWGTIISAPSEPVESGVGPPVLSLRSGMGICMRAEPVDDNARFGACEALESLMAVGGGKLPGELRVNLLMGRRRVWGVRDCPLLYELHVGAVEELGCGAGLG